MITLSAVSPRSKRPGGQCWGTGPNKVPRVHAGGDPIGISFSILCGRGRTSRHRIRRPGPGRDIWMPTQEKKVLEIGCGSGANLLRLMMFGFSPENLVANELLEKGAQEARKRLPSDIRVIPCDASTLDLRNEASDVVMSWTVFTSIIDESFQQRLADRMWALVRPKGGVAVVRFRV